jgi:hypothetical protein
MYFKAITMNNSGNVGKSMVCDTFLKPRIKDAVVIKVETLNSDGTEDETISAKDIKQVFERIDSADVAIVDVGSSNMQSFMENLQKMGNAHEDFDLFIVPTITTHKQQIDTIATVESLLDLGVEKEKIFNFYDQEFAVEQLYPAIFDSTLVKTLGLNNRKNIITISENPVFDIIGEMGKSFTNIATDNRDFKALIRAEKDKGARAVLSHQRSAHRLANGFIKELDMAFKKLMASCKLEVTE